MPSQLSYPLQKPFYSNSQCPSKGSTSFTFVHNAWYLFQDGYSISQNGAFGVLSDDFINKDLTKFIVHGLWSRTAKVFIAKSIPKNLNLHLNYIYPESSTANLFELPLNISLCDPAWRRATCAKSISCHCSDANNYIITSNLIMQTNCINCLPNLIFNTQWNIFVPELLIFLHSCISCTLGKIKKENKNFYVHNLKTVDS